MIKYRMKSNGLRFIYLPLNVYSYTCIYIWIFHLKIIHVTGDCIAESTAIDITCDLLIFAYKKNIYCTFDIKKHIYDHKKYSIVSAALSTQILN